MEPFQKIHFGCRMSRCFTFVPEFFSELSFQCASIIVLLVMHCACAALHFSTSPPVYVFFVLFSGFFLPSRPPSDAMLCLDFPMHTPRQRTRSRVKLLTRDNMALPVNRADQPTCCAMDLLSKLCAHEAPAHFTVGSSFFVPLTLFSMSIVHLF